MDVTPVEERLRRRIALTGPISVAEYMAACLTDPDGYYARQEPFGAGGDFVTAPEISAMFGELVGAWLLDRWRADGAPAPFDLVELGPGRGTLMADVLSVCRRDPGFAGGSRVVLVEASERLKGVQRERLGPLHPRLAWLDRLPEERPVYLVANEFFDALPVRQFVATGGRWVERVVGLRDGRLAFGLAPGAAAPAPGVPDGAVREVRPAAETLIGTLARTLVRHGAGAALIVDYGYLDGFGETLQAVRRHAPAPVLERPGEADLSAHVHFAPLVEAARREGAAVHGPVGQGDVLLALGLLERAGRLGAGADEAGRAAIRAAVQRLAGTGEGEMGALFRAMAVTARAGPVPGFDAGVPQAGG